MCARCGQDCTDFWCDPCWSVLKARVLAKYPEPKVDPAPKVDETMVNALGLESSLTSKTVGKVTSEPLIEQVDKPNFRPGGGLLWVIQRKVMPWERR